MKITANSILSFSAIFGACLYAATAHADMTNPPHPTPPQEAIQACSGKADKDACSFTGRHNEALSGSCHKGHDGKGELACVPSHAPGHPGGAEQPSK